MYNVFCIMIIKMTIFLLLGLADACACGPFEQSFVLAEQSFVLAEQSFLRACAVHVWHQ